MATITTTLGAGSVATPFFVDVKITKQLCAKTPNAPVFNPTFTLVSYKSVGTGQYEALVNVQGSLSYTPCHSCCAKTQTVNENFVIPFYSEVVPSIVAVTGGTPINTLVGGGCCKCGCGCSNTFACNVPLQLDVTSAG